MYKYSYDSSSEGSDSEDHSKNSIGTLDFSSCQLTSENIVKYLENFDDQFSKRFEIVDTLILDHNFLGVISLDISRFTNLKTLDLSNNQIKSLPEAVCQLPLVSLIVKNNRLTDAGLPKCFQKLISLKVCNMSGNQLSTFPNQVLSAKNLEYLYVGNNRITEVPKQIETLQK